MTIFSGVDVLAKSIMRSRVVDTSLRYNPIYYPNVRRIIRDVEQQTIDERRLLAQRLLSRSLKWAKNTRASFYKNHDFSNWPILEKEHLRGNETQFLRRNLVRVPSTTGGSSGVPIKLWRSLRCIAAEQAFIDSVIEPFASTYRNARIVVLRADEIKAPTDWEPPFGKLQTGGRRLILSSRHVSSATASWFADAINNYAPDIIRIYPSAGESLAKHLVEQGLYVHVPVIMSSSEMIGPAGWELLTRAFNASLIDHYGLSERVAFAVATEKDRHFFNPAYGLIELHPTDDLEPGMDVKLAEIIATSFWNDCMPLIRFRTGDFARYPAHYTADDLQAVALGCKPFLGIAGREKDYLLSPTEEILSGMNHISRDATNVLRVQIIQRSLHRVEILLLTTLDFGEADREVIMTSARRVIPDSMCIEINAVENLQQASSGKIPYVIREV